MSTTAEKGLLFSHWGFHKSKSQKMLAFLFPTDSLYPWVLKEETTSFPLFLFCRSFQIWHGLISHPFLSFPFVPSTLTLSATIAETRTNRMSSYVKYSHSRCYYKAPLGYVTYWVGVIILRRLKDRNARCKTVVQ